MKRVVVILAVMALVAMTVVGCTPKETDSGVSTEETTAAEENVKDESTEEEPLTVTVGIPLGAPAVSMAKLMKEQPDFGENVEVIYETIPAPDQLAAKVINNEVDMVILPTNLAAKLYNKGVEYKLASANVWGLLYVVSTEDIDSWDDLEGKEITSFGMGLTPDIIFQYLLSKNIETAEDSVTINYVNAGSEVAPLIISGKSSIAVLPEPLITVAMAKNDKIKVVFDLQEEWAKISEAQDSYPQASLMVSNKLIENNKEFVDAFLSEYKNGSQWANDEPMEAGAYYEALELGLTQGVIGKGLPRMNIRFGNAIDEKQSINEYLNVLLEYSPESIGGKLPDEGFYMEK